MRCRTAQFLQAADSEPAWRPRAPVFPDANDRDADFQPELGASTVPALTRRMISANSDGVSGAKFQMGITVKFDEFNRCAQKAAAFFASAIRCFGCAMRSSFAARANDKMRFASGASFVRDDAAAAKLDVVGMRAKGQQRRNVQRSSV